MNDDLIIYGGAALALVLIAWKFKTGFGKILPQVAQAGTGQPGNSKITLQDRIDYTRSAMYTAHESNNVSEYLRLQRELELLELELF